MKTVTLTEKRVERVIELLKNHHTTEAYARTTDGRPTRGNDPEAVCWCALGAIEKVCAPKGTLLRLGEIPAEIFTNIVSLNDHGRLHQLCAELRKCVGMKIGVREDFSK